MYMIISEYISYAHDIHSRSVSYIMFDDAGDGSAMFGDEQFRWIF